MVVMVLMLVGWMARGKRESKREGDQVSDTERALGGIIEMWKDELERN